MTVDYAVKVYKALGESTRMQFVRMLVKRRELACLERAELLNNTSASTLTHHLKPLLECGGIAVRKVGTSRF
ncbi:helix-turn-helix transcriptional regulator, partial [Paenibacillus sp. GbtcB18]|uniref:ArsR/SmtB family transcription factor n=1 Tax=Paenibacillus sp. GbtcB18 TaxID=2824763 RepID=UPI001C30DCE4